MEVIYGLLPGMLLLGIIGVGVFFWAVRNGQYDDMDGAANRVLLDDDDENQDSGRNNRSEGQADDTERSSHKN
ncbi:cbb3-type cytochrome oxidase assembly protein CcoS [Methylophaga sp.]|jgi:cbb3-type cytochrome oxidase maturation protein|uniref:cbb3-type cytochrome oxidase assembly protein CcoS n=1 Tax=Methylophaga sp. TaxID=2024840 RepID=UPI0014011133|nr:cbb3-type cytochrome oxidase assembly protein CcoS [Methylophaga sp.]MTI64636.1 cbb3-type cytochrome oxidase assembly protein CcoS [Methylophaga sp.]